MLQFYKQLTAIGFESKQMKTSQMNWTLDYFQVNNAFGRSGSPLTSFKQATSQKETQGNAFSSLHQINLNKQWFWCLKLFRNTSHKALFHFKSKIFLMILWWWKRTCQMVVRNKSSARDVTSFTRHHTLETELLQNFTPGVQAAPQYTGYVQLAGWLEPHDFTALYQPCYPHSPVLTINAK